MKAKFWKILITALFFGCALGCHTLGASLGGTDFGQEMALRQVQDVSVKETGYSLWEFVSHALPWFLIGAGALVWWRDVSRFVRGVRDEITVSQPGGSQPIEWGPAPEPPASNEAPYIHVPKVSSQKASSQEDK